MKHWGDKQFLSSWSLSPHHCCPLLSLRLLLAAFGCLCRFLVICLIASLIAILTVDVALVVFFVAGVLARD